jgi:hypothetical protein
MKSFKRIFTSTIVLSLIPFLIIVFAVPIGFKKYSLKLEDKLIHQDNVYIRYDDLDNDGSTEEIDAYNFDYTTAITIYKNRSVIDQWNLKGSFDFWFKKCLFITGDRDNDGKKEIYVFTLNGDTILLHCISDISNQGLSIKNRIIAITGKGNKSADPFIIQAEMDDLNGDGEKELIFGIGSGFSKYPRNVYAYFISKDSLIVSPESSYFISNILQADINNDGKKEIIPYGYAASNVSPENARYHDYSSFIMVLDQNLKFLFNPVEFRGRYSAVSPFLRKRDENLSLAWLHSHVADLNSSTIYIVNNSGLITDSVTLSFYAGAPKYLPDWDEGKGLTEVSLRNGIGLVNNDLELIKTLPLLKPTIIAQQDFDLDGKQEILISDVDRGKIYIMRDRFRESVSASIDLSGLGQDLISLKSDGKTSPLISIQSGLNQYIFRYGISPFWPYYYLYYPGLYLSILAFVLTVKNIQKNQTKKKYETEKKISELQLALVRNQLDPHFTFNVINSIIYSVEFSEKEQAGEQLRQFAAMYRNMLLSANSTRRTIDEELDFCKNYLLLEKMRFKERFNYRISVSEDIDRNFLIPKLLIQIHVENAVKHGLSLVEKGGNIDIELKKEDGVLLIEIADNGIGRVKSAGLGKISTGKGLETMEELYSIYNKYYNEKVSSQIVDLYDQEGSPIGTKVSIRIKNQNEKG